MNKICLRFAYLCDVYYLFGKSGRMFLFFIGNGNDVEENVMRPQSERSKTFRVCSIANQANIDVYNSVYV